MGNSIGNRRMAVVVRTNGDTFRLPCPIQAGKVLANYPGHVLLESEEARRRGIGASLMDPDDDLEPKRIYFLIPKSEFPEESRILTKSRSEVRLSAWERLESIKMRRSAPAMRIAMAPTDASGVRVTIRVKKSEIERMLREDGYGKEAAAAAAAQEAKNSDRRSPQRHSGLCTINESDIKMHATGA